MRWACERCGEPAGARPTRARRTRERYARAFDRRDAEELGKRPLLSLLPLWLARKAGGRGPKRPA